MNLAAESLAMRLARWLGWEKGAWALRRLHCPVPKEALVLEVGSGGNPYPRANVLLDAHTATRQRHWAPLVSDRPTVLGLVENLPFRDGAFDFVIASHVLEHSADPERFLAELQRVGKAGYIESPDAFMERVNPYRDHRVEVTVRDGRLLIRKKPAWRTDPELVELYEQRAKHWIAQETIPAHPSDFHVRYYWEGRIDFEIANPNEDAGWEAPPDDSGMPATVDRSGAKGRILRLARSWLSQGARNQALDLLSLLRCPACSRTAMRRESIDIVCPGCQARYPSNGAPDLRIRKGC